MAARDAPLAIEPSHTSTSPRKASASPRPSQALLLPVAGLDRALRQRAENLLDQRQALLDLANADPYPRIDVTGVEHRHLEGESS